MVLWLMKLQSTKIVTSRVSVYKSFFSPWFAVLSTAQKSQNLGTRRGCTGSHVLRAHWVPGSVDFWKVRLLPDEDTEPPQGPCLPVTQNSGSADMENHHRAGLDLFK